MTIKQTIPFDSLSAADEFRCRERRIKETLSVRVAGTGAVAERITRKLLPSQTTLHYGGEELLIRGSGFDRYIQL